MVNPLAQRLVLAPVVLVRQRHEHRARVALRRMRERHRRAQAVLVRGVLVVRLHVGRERGAEGHQGWAQQLRRDPPAIEHRRTGLEAHGRGGAVDEQCPGRHRHAALLQHHFAGVQCLDVAHAHDIANAAQHLQLARRQRGEVEHLRLALRIDAHQRTAGFQAQVEIVDGSGLGEGFELVGLPAHGLEEEFGSVLRAHPVDDPGVARHHPLDRLGGRPALLQPHAGVHRRLAGADDHEAPRRRRATLDRLPQRRQGVRRHQPHTRAHFELRRVRGRHFGAEVGAVHRLAAHAHLRAPPRQQRFDRSVLEHVAQRVVADAAAGQQPLVHYAVEVADDLGAGGQLIQAPVQADRVAPAAAQRHRVHAVERRRLVQSDKAIGVVPVTAGLAAPVDEGDVRVGLGKQRVGEGQTYGTGADDEVVGLDVIGMHAAALS